MPTGFSAAQLEHYGNITLNHKVRGKLFENGIQNKPLFEKMRSKKKTFRASLSNLSYGVRFDRGAGGVNDGVAGYSHLDTVSFYNPGGAKRAEYDWKEHHIGMTLSETELKQQGILIGEEYDGAIKKGSDKMVILSGILTSAVTDMEERYAVTMDNLLWGTGAADPKSLAGLRAFIRDIPTLGTVGGLSSVTIPKWRSRARTAAFLADGSFDANHGGGAVTSTPANGGALLQVLQEENRQLIRYGGNWDCFHAGTDFIGAMETEIRANGNYSDTGFTKNQDGSIGEMIFKGRKVIYDPSLDDLGREKFAYLWDSKRIWLDTMDGDWERARTPKRPHNQFVFHKSMVATGQMCADSLDHALVIEIT